MNSIALQRSLPRSSATFSRVAASSPRTAAVAARASERSSFSASPSRMDGAMLTRLGSLFAPAKPSSEDPFQDLRDSALLKAIHDSSAGKHVKSYTEAKKIMFTDLDVHEGKVKCVYTGREIAGGKVPPSTDMNVEHTWPQSLGAVGPAKSDLHHLFPTDSKANSIRGNFPFGKVETVKWSSPSGAKFGLDAKGHKVFEPPDAHKGDVARAMFYFSAEYGKHIPNDEEAVLREWNKLDAVDAGELERDQRIAGIQGNLNQFVEHSDLADRIQDF